MEIGEGKWGRPCFYNFLAYLPGGRVSGLRLGARFPMAISGKVEEPRSEKTAHSPLLPLVRWLHKGRGSEWGNAARMVESGKGPKRAMD